jgi:hypothetical protein
MTASMAASMFRTAKPITRATITMEHLDMLQMSDIDERVRMLHLPFADDALRCGDRTSPSLSFCVIAFNLLAGR